MTHDAPGESLQTLETRSSDRDDLLRASDDCVDVFHLLLIINPLQSLFRLTGTPGGAAV